MTMFTAHSTLADIVTARPSLARVLEARVLDYCCGGSATLQDACGAHQLDADAALADLTASALRKLLNGEYGAASEPVEPTFATSPGQRVYGGEYG